jgi:hypothetical protein
VLGRGAGVSLGEVVRTSARGGRVGGDRRHHEEVDQCAPMGVEGQSHAGRLRSRLATDTENHETAWILSMEVTSASGFLVVGHYGPQHEPALELGEPSRPVRGHASRQALAQPFE